MNKTTPREKNETMLGLYALTANKTSKPDNCPSDENMAAFIDHQLDGKDRQEILKHLNHCPTCYEVWMSSCDAIEMLLPSRQKETTFWKKTWHKVTNYQQIWTFGIPTAAVSAIIALLVIWIDPNNINKRISDIYSQNIVHSDRYATVLKTMPLPWEKTALGFDLTPLSAATRAYGAGLWEGRAKLMTTINQSLPNKLSPLNNTPWPDSDWSDYYAFGRWTVMLWTALESGQEIANWEDYKNIHERLLANFSKQPTTNNDSHLANLALNKISYLLDKAEQFNDQTHKKRLVHELKLTMYRLGPDHL